MHAPRPGRLTFQVHLKKHMAVIVEEFDRRSVRYYLLQDNELNLVAEGHPALLDELAHLFHNLATVLKPCEEAEKPLSKKRAAEYLGKFIPRNT